MMLQIFIYDIIKNIYYKNRGKKMSVFICPICGKELIENSKSLCCANNHNFDIAKSGYVNLLMSNQISAKHHGDDKLMVRSRQSFLNKGYYNVILESVINTVNKYVKSGIRIIDVGCGECYYTSNIYEFLKKNQIATQMIGIDISKDALVAGAKRNSEIKLAVASIFRIPVMDNSCDMLFNFFAPNSPEEFNRIIKKEGIIIRIIPLEKHLWSLKKAVYDNPYENEVVSETLLGCKLLEKKEIKRKIKISCNQDIINSFRMTPYYYKTSIKDQKKVEFLDELETEIEIGILIYRKNE